MPKGPYRWGQRAGLPVSPPVTLVLLFFLLVLAGCLRVPGPTREEIPFDAKPGPQVTGFYVNGRGQGSSYSSLSDHRQLVDVISPLWYRVRGDGSLEEDIDPDALKFAAANGIKVIPLVVLAPGGSRVLLEPEAKERVIDTIAGLVREKGYAGINIDFELIISPGRDYTAEKEGLNGIVAGLGERLKQNGCRLDVCVTPPIRPPSHLAPIYDVRALAGQADRLVLMAYDYSHPGSRPGPLAPLPWVQDNINWLLDAGIEPGKISLGVAAYGYDWPAAPGRGKARPSAEIMQMAAERDLAVLWDEQSQGPYIKYQDERGPARQIWFENSSSADKKTELVRKHQLAGISIWRLGYDEDNFWPVVEKLKGDQTAEGAGS